jgi:hypothetical protein
VLTGTVPVHPARYSKAVLDIVKPLIDSYNLPVHDPFAGTGERLGRAVRGMMLEFSGTDIETWQDMDWGVKQGDSRVAATYPRGDFIVVTSPVYFGNRISSDYADGPLSTTKARGRHAYGISLGRPLDPDNMARLCRATRGSEHDAMALACMKHWGYRAIVNVDAPIADRWVRLGWEAGYITYRRIEAKTRRVTGGLTGVSKRAPHEVVLVMHRRIKV